jgi:hypothetical protein
MAKHIHFLRVIGCRTAKIQRYSDQGFFMMVALDEKLAEGRQVRLNVFDTYSDFYHAIVESDKYKRKVDEELHDLTDQPAQMTDAFTLEVFPDRRGRYVHLKNRLVDAIKERKLRGIANRCFRNMKEGYLPKSGFLRFSRKVKKFKNE